MLRVEVTIHSQVRLSANEVAALRGPDTSEYIKVRDKILCLVGKSALTRINTDLVIDLSAGRT